LPDACSEHLFDLPDRLYHPVIKKSVILKIYCLARLLPDWITRPVVNMAKRLFSLTTAG